MMHECFRTARASMQRDKEISELHSAKLHPGAGIKNTKPIHGPRPAHRKTGQHVLYNKKYINNT